MNEEKNIIENSTFEDATHYINCAHAIGTSRKEYRMRCIPLKITKKGKVKILLFGERYWMSNRTKKRVMYVPRWKVKPMKFNGQTFLIKKK